MDRFTRGFVSGALAGAGTSILHIILKRLGAVQLRWADFAALLVYSRFATTTAEALLAQYTVWLFDGAAGIGFAYLVANTTSRGYHFKGWVYSSILWFLIFALGILLNVPELAEISFETAISNAAAATVWGLLVAEILYRLDKAPTSK